MTDDEKRMALDVLQSFATAAVRAEQPTADPLALIALHDRLMASWRDGADDEACVVACGLSLVARWVTLSPEQRATSTAFDRAMRVLQTVSVGD